MSRRKTWRLAALAGPLVAAILVGPASAGAKAVPHRPARPCNPSAGVVAANEQIVVYADRWVPERYLACRPGSRRRVVLGRVGGMEDSFGGFAVAGTMVAFSHVACSHYESTACAGFVRVVDVKTGRERSTWRALPRYSTEPSGIVVTASGTAAWTSTVYPGGDFALDQTVTQVYVLPSGGTATMLDQGHGIPGRSVALVPSVLEGEARPKGLAALWLHDGVARSAQVG
jgi:hypothetical protein